MEEASRRSAQGDFEATPSAGEAMCGWFASFASETCHRNDESSHRNRMVDLSIVMCKLVSQGVDGLRWI